MAGLRFAFPVEYVPDIDSAKRFYVDVFGYRVERDHPVFVQLRGADGNAFALAGDQPMEPGKNLELWWEVDDAEAALRELSSKAEIAMPLQQYPFGKVFAVANPAGERCYVLEWATERPSQPVE